MESENTNNTPTTGKRSFFKKPLVMLGLVLLIGTGITGIATGYIPFSHKTVQVTVPQKAKQQPKPIVKKFAPPKQVAPVPFVPSAPGSAMDPSPKNVPATVAPDAQTDVTDTTQKVASNAGHSHG